MALALGIGGLTGCGGDPETGPQVRRVGTDYRTIQAAVDAANPGDLVLIDPGTYHEAVQVETPRLVIRGRDRNTVILDGRDTLLNGFEVTADRVAIENLTVRRYSINGVLFAGADGTKAQSGPSGWRASYVTASNNGLYGLYAFGTGPGQFDHDYASGHPDSGIYVGQCRACGAVVLDNTMEHNAIGYENTNASGVTVARNIMRSNRIGMTVNSGNSELLAPQAGGEVVANLVADNDDPDTPESEGGFGVGIAVAGGTDNTISANVIRGHPGAGILVIDQDGFLPTGNRVTGNRLADNATDLALAAEAGDTPASGRNCFSGNDAATTSPPALERLLACDAAAGNLPLPTLALPEAPGGVSYQDVPAPKAQPQMPGRRLDVWTVPAAKPKPVETAGLTAPKG